MGDGNDEYVELKVPTEAQRQLINRMRRLLETDAVVEFEVQRLYELTTSASADLVEFVAEKKTRATGAL
jgi:hypothetical protein